MSAHACCSALQANGTTKAVHYLAKVIKRYEAQLLCVSLELPPLDFSKQDMQVVIHCRRAEYSAFLL